MNDAAPGPNCKTPHPHLLPPPLITLPPYPAAADASPMHQALLVGCLACFIFIAFTRPTELTKLTEWYCIRRALDTSPAGPGGRLS